MSGIQEKADEIVKEFSQYDDWMDKYHLLIERGKELPLIDPSGKTDENLINGCQSKVWLTAEYREGKLYYKAESDALITRGLISMIIYVYSGHTPDEILSVEPVFIEESGLRQHLSPTRSNGLTAMIKQMKFYAMAWKIKSQNNT